MILVFGGTTEGRKVAELLDFIGEEYIYSTKTKTSQNVNGKIISGGMVSSEIIDFCNVNNIKLIVDAAHPFAFHLHENIYLTSKETGITTIRYERTYPELEDGDRIKTFPSFQEMIMALQQSAFKNILSLTGVQTIPNYQTLRKEKTCYYRILNTNLSRTKAKSCGIDDKYLIPSGADFDIESIFNFIKENNIDVITSKESGHSGLFENKMKAAEELDIPLWVVKRPMLPSFTYLVDNQKQLQQLLYKFRKTNLKVDGELRSGFTTGTCVTAAAKACVISLAEGEFPPSVEVTLPNGEETQFLIFPKELTNSLASCTVVKDAGDDPDITHGKEIGCEISLNNTPGIKFLRGKGIGLVTLPGLTVAKDEPAINPVPRKMITSVIEELSDLFELDFGFDVKPFVPEGEELAKQTFNPRVGVVGGISIIGTTGIVKPFSNEAFLASIDRQLNVAKENGCNHVVLSSGKRSENILRKDLPQLPDTAFIHFGNFIGETIKIATKKGIKKITLGIMLGKATKLAEGHLDTHSKKVVFNARHASEIATKCGYSIEIASKIKKLKLANAIRDFIEFTPEEPFYNEIAQLCFKNCQKLITDKIIFQSILLTDKGDKIVIEK